MAEIRVKPSGKLRRGFPPANSSNVSLSKSVNSNNKGRGVSKASAMHSITLSEGLALPLVRPLKNESDIFARIASSCFVTPCSSSKRNKLGKKNLVVH